MKTITDTWGKAANDRRLITEVTANTLREAEAACLDLLIQAQHTTGIHNVSSAGGFKDVGSGYSVELRWSEKGDHWWNPQQRLTLHAPHAYGYVYADGAVYMGSVGMDVNKLTTMLAEGLAYKYIR